MSNQNKIYIGIIVAAVFISGYFFFQSCNNVSEEEKEALSSEVMPSVVKDTKDIADKFKEVANGQTPTERPTVIEDLSSASEEFDTNKDTKCDLEKITDFGYFEAASMPNTITLVISNEQKDIALDGIKFDELGIKLISDTINKGDMIYIAWMSDSSARLYTSEGVSIAEYLLKQNGADRTE